MNKSLNKQTIKRITRYFAILLYTGLLAICLLIIIKPGASIFYIKQNMDAASLSPDAGFAFRYKLKFYPIFFRVQNILVFEGKQPLTPAGDREVINQGEGSYSISTPSHGVSYIYFSTSDNTSPITNQRPYTLYLPLKFISRPLGFAYVGLLLPMLIWFSFFAFAVPEHRRLILGSPRKLIKIADLFTEHAFQQTQAYFRRLWQRICLRAPFWKRLFIATVLFTFLYTFMEWLFFVTMPSFMSSMHVQDKVMIFTLSGFIFSLFSLALLLAFILIEFLAIVAHTTKYTRFIGILIPTIILSSLVLLLIDNFTYTLFKFGISTSSGAGRGVYGILFCLLNGYIYYQMLRAFGLLGSAQPTKFLGNRFFYASVGLLVVGLGLAIGKTDWGSLSHVVNQSDSVDVSRRPNVLILGSDGVNAANMSVYGYKRPTTPQLEQLAPTSLVAENAFTNAGNTAGSVISIMTSKLPTQTRLLYPPDILTGINSFEHLPGILKNLGYKTVEYGVPYYVDSYAFNLQDGFDMVNGRSFNAGNLGNLGRKLGFADEVYFLTRLYWRLTDRIGHIFFIHEMENPFDLVTKPSPNISDQVKIDQTLALFDQSTDPLFIHVHLLGTHGGFYDVKNPVFSKGEDQFQPWSTDFYDDTILQFDRYVGEVIDHLKKDGQFDNTILIIYTDHAKMFKVTDRIPLIIHFPDDAYAGQVTANVENLDIAPTILDYLGLPIPEWMGGASLLKGDAIGSRLIFSAGTTKVKPNEEEITFLDPSQNKPPFYQFSFLNVLNCQKMYSFDLTTYQWSSGEVIGYVEPCDPKSLLNFDQIKQAIYQRLETDGFDISSLP
jgi:glucan phosphoethanolaminetransferase (alkaline phosphatase superfamily)